MVIACLFLLIVALTTLLKKNYFSINVLLILLPHQYILKKVFDNQFNSGEIFAFWKEIIILILFIKTIKAVNLNKHLTYLLYLIFIFYCVVLIYYTLSPDYFTSLANLRNYTFPIFIFLILVFKKIELNVISLVKNIVITTFISNILGVLQLFFFNVPFSLYKGTIDEIDENGYIQYATNSHRIMGIERMSGGFSGPNDFGMYLAIALLVIMFIFIKPYSENFSKKIKILSFITFFTSFICFLLTFSRAGWFVFIFGLLVFSLFYYKHRILTLTFLFITVTVLAVVLPLISETISDIIVNSFTLKEASASDRSGQFTRGAEMAFLEPFGHGVGTTDLRYKNTLSFSVESAWWNLSYELGLIGLVLYIVINYKINSSLHSNYKYSIRSNILFPLDLVGILITLPTILIGFFSLNPLGTTYVFYYWIFCGLAFQRANLLKPQIKLMVYNFV